jgi:hypothetical protein
VINVAPGEGQHPVNVYLDKNAEEMANPDIFGGRARPSNCIHTNSCAAWSYGIIVA